MRYGDVVPRFRALSTPTIEQVELDGDVIELDVNTDQMWGEQRDTVYVRLTAGEARALAGELVRLAEQVAGG